MAMLADSSRVVKASDVNCAPRSLPNIKELGQLSARNEFRLTYDLEIPRLTPNLQKLLHVVRLNIQGRGGMGMEAGRPIMQFFLLLQRFLQLRHLFRHPVGRNNSVFFHPPGELRRYIRLWKFRK